MKQTFKSALISTIPVLTGYLVLGFGFGIILKSAGFGILPAVAMSVLIYAGSMQYVAVGLLTGGASLLTVALTTFAVNARHLFYGISMLDTYKDMGTIKPYLIFSLTDETYSLLCTGAPEIPSNRKKQYFFLVSLLNHAYWVLGTLAGAVIGALISFNSEGIAFALTALFLTVFIEQWMSSKKHAPAIFGVLISLLCLVIFGRAHFLIPTMIGIALVLSFYSEGKRHV